MLHTHGARNVHQAVAAAGNAAMPPGLGYAGPAYPLALEPLGRATPLARSGGWCLIRGVAGTPWQDASGPYPFMVCDDWTALPEDILGLEGEAISVVFVTDPLADVPVDRIARACPDLCRRYKDHHVLDLGAGQSPQWSSHHRRNVRHGLRNTTVEIAARPADWVADWIALYDLLIARHAINGPARFSADSFRAQFDVHGLLAARGVVSGETVGMTLWFIMGDRAYYHLGAATPRGYECRAMFAMFATMIDELASRGVRRLCLGAGAGAHAASQGLDRFKSGWANRVVPARICGRILDRAAYAAACRAVGGPGGASFFPAYRRP